jgi:hypothetical protein
MPRTTCRGRHGPFQDQDEESANAWNRRAPAQDDGGGNLPHRLGIDVAENGPLAAIAIPVDEETVDRVIIRHRPNAGKRQQCLDLQGENEIAALACPVEGLDPEPVAGTEQPRLSTVPDREGIHPFEMRQAILAPFPVELEEHFRVRPRGKSVTARLKLDPELQVIVYLAVEDDPGAAVPHRHRLESALRQTEDRQAAVAKGHLRARLQVPLRGAPDKCRGSGQSP